MLPDISFVVPFRNEARHLAGTLESLAAQELNGRTAEVLLFDGMSTDDSRAIAEAFAARSTPAMRFRVFENPRVTAAAGFNEGIAKSCARVVGFGGAHAHYPTDYLRNALAVLEESGADVVGGGHTGFVADRKGTVPRAMACLYQSPMGSGVAQYHRRKTPGFVDTVFGGFYRRAVFDMVGTFDESLPRNQDNELNSRVTTAGFRVYFDPRLSTEYVIKTEWKSFLRRPLMFGLNHPRTWLVNWRAFRLRHAVPALFVTYLMLVAVLGLMAGARTALVAAVPVLLYVLLLIAAAAKLARREGAAVAAASVPVFFSYHVTYGAGTLAGLISGVWWLIRRD